MSVPAENKPLGFSVLAKPSGAICNLACGYCFYSSKTQLYPGSTFRMSDQVLAAYLQQYLESQPGSEVSVAWQGGEPTLIGLDFFIRSVELAEKFKKPDQKIVYTLQTNGTRLDDAWCSFFKEHNFLIGLSIDGPPALHNTFRVDKLRQGSYNQVKQGWDLLQKHNVETNILCAVHSANGSHPKEVYHFLRDDLQARFIQFIPVVEQLQVASKIIKSDESRIPSHSQMFSTRNTEHLVSPRSVKPKQYGNFLIDIFDEWVRKDVGTVFVQIFDAALANWVGVPAGVCVFQETCGRAVIMEHNGDVYACDHFVEPDYRLGNILETSLIDLVNLPGQIQFGQDKRDALPDFCISCKYIFACHGECLRNRFIPVSREQGAQNPRNGLNYLCNGYRLFFEHIDRPMRSMVDLLHRQRPPAEIMRQYAIQDASMKELFSRTGRNDLCPCGSGKRFKHCHGRVKRM